MPFSFGCFSGGTYKIKTSIYGFNISIIVISFPEQTLSVSASTSPNSQISTASAARAETLSDALGTRFLLSQLN